jgi:hypothetical protein
MSEVCPPFIDTPNVHYDANRHIQESNFLGLFKTEICVLQGDDNDTFILRWQHKFLWFRTEIQQRVLRHLQ